MNRWFSIFALATAAMACQSDEDAKGAYAEICSIATANDCQEGLSCVKSVGAAEGLCTIHCMIDTECSDFRAGAICQGGSCYQGCTPLMTCRDFPGLHCSMVGTTDGICIP